MNTTQPGAPGQGDATPSNAASGQLRGNARCPWGRIASSFEVKEALQLFRPASTNEQMT